MSEPANPTPGPDPVPPTVEALQREIEELRWRLARKTTGAAIHRETGHDWLHNKMGYTALTEDEIRELLTAPRADGESIRDIIEAYVRRVGG